MGCGASSDTREKYEFLKAIREDLSQELSILFRCGQEENEKKKKRQEAAEAFAKAAKAQEKAWKNPVVFC